MADLGAASGPLVGALSATANLIQTLVWMILEMKEARAGNKILANPGNIDISVFEVCRLLGCYILTSSTRSNILAWLAEDIGADYWMDVVGVLNKRITPILAIASHRIADARYELPVPPGSNAVMHAGDVIRSDEGDIFIKLERIKAQAVGKAKNGILHPQMSWRNWRAGKQLKTRIKDQAGIAWDD